MILVVAGGAAGVLLVRALVGKRGGSILSPAASPGAPAIEPTDYADIPAKAGTAQNAQRIRALADRFTKVWTDVTGKSGPVPPAAMELLLAHAGAERTGYGQGWEMTGNVGAYHCSGTTGTSYYDCAPHEDSRPTPQGQVKYTTYFRKYKNGVTPDGKSRDALEAGAWDFLRSVTVKPFPALDEILAGDILRYVRKQFGQHYFEAFNMTPDGLAAYAPWPGRLVAAGVPLFNAKGKQIAVSQSDGTWRAMGSDPVPSDASPPMMVAGRIVFYGASMARNLAEIAAALGHTKVEARVARGLEQPWQPRFQASSGKAVA